MSNIKWGNRLYYFLKIKYNKGLKLINFDLDEKNPNDCSYVYSGLAPVMFNLKSNQ